MQTYQGKKLPYHSNLMVTVPGSKSITNRALLLAALAEGRSILDGVLFSDDSNVFLQALRDLGFTVEVDEKAYRVELQGMGGKIPDSDDSDDGGKVSAGCFRADEETADERAF